MAVWPPATHADATAAIQELRTEGALIPIARWLPSNYVAGTTDIGQYVQAAVDASEPTGNCQFILPAGTHLWNTPVYLDAAVRDLSYSFIGHGKNTYITLGSGLNGQYALHNNENASGVVGIASPGYPRLTVADMTIDGNGAGTKGMVFTNASTVRVYNVKTIDVYRLVQTVGYCDNMEFRKIRVQVPNVTGAIMYYNHGNGDGLIMEQIAAGDNIVVADLQGCNGATISSGIVGVYKFTACESITVISFHNDGGDDNTGYQTSPSFIITSSRVNFYGGWDQIGTISPVIQINDSQIIGYSEVLINGWQFTFRPHTADKVRTAHVQVLAAQPSTKVRFRSCGSDFEPENTNNRYPAGPTFSAADSNIQAAFDAWPTAMLEDTDLVQTDVGWQFIAAGTGGRPFRRIATTPAITAATTSATVPGNHTAGTKFYKVAVYTDKTRSLHTAASTEASIAVSGTQSAQLTVTTRATPAMVRVWRGTATGVYTAYADVAISAFSAVLFDTGTAINGTAWIATSVPTPPTVNTTLDGLTLGRLADFHGPAFPTEGTWSVGDRVTNSAPAASGTIGWVCTTAGTPGTWKTYGAISP